MTLSTSLQKIKIIKYLLIIALIAITSYIVIAMMARDHIDDNAQQDVLAGDAKLDMTESEYSLNITNSVLEGYSKDNKPYKITANTVNQLDEGKYDLSDVFAKYDFNNRKCTIESEDATLYDNDGYIILKRDVKLNLGEAVLKSEGLELNLDNRDAKSHSPVIVQSKDSTITSDKFSTENSTDILYFEGNVISCFSK